MPVFVLVLVPAERVGGHSVATVEIINSFCRCHLPSRILSGTSLCDFRSTSGGRSQSVLLKDEGEDEDEYDPLPLPSRQTKT